MLRTELLRYARGVSEAEQRDAVQALWEASSRRLRAWFERRTGSAHDADDLVQETFARVAAKLASVRDGERLDAWVGAIAGNVLADHGRKRARRDEPLEDADEGGLANAGGNERDFAGASEGENADLRQAVAGWVEAFLARLDPEDSALLRAVELEGRAQVEVARELGLAPSGARSRVQRARARLRWELEACCRFAFDRRGNVTEAQRRAGAECGCDEEQSGTGC